MSRPVFMRFGPSLVAGFVYLIFALFWAYDGQVYETLLRVFDAMPEARPFNDLDAILQAGACWREGVNVYAPSSCMHGGLYNYSPFLLRAAYLPIGPQDRIGGGVLLGVLFLAGFALLPPPRTWAEFVLRCFAVCSGTVMYAVETANFDVVIYLLVLAAILLWLAKPVVSWLGYVLVLFAAALKFYPAALMVLVLRERLRWVVGVALLSAVAGGAFLARYGHGTATAIAILPEGLPFRCVFGAVNLPFGLLLLRDLPVLTLEPDVQQYFVAMGHPFAAAFIILTARVMTVAALIWAIIVAPKYRGLWQGLDARRQVFFLAGAVTIVFCFLAAQNLDYRGVFFLLTLPGLWAMAGRADEAMRRGMLALLAAVLVLLWEGFFRHLVAVAGSVFLPSALAVYPGIAFWLFRDCLWWWVVVRLAAFVVCFLYEGMAKLQTEIGGRFGMKRLEAGL